MCSHLSHQHTHDWILTCNANDIKITATGVQEILVEYWSSQGEEHTDSTNKSHKPYSREAFVDALVEFIVADDQVSKIDCNVHDVDKSFHFNTRQLMLLNVENSETYCWCSKRSSKMQTYLIEPPFRNEWKKFYLNTLIS